MQGATGRVFTLTTHNNANAPMRRSLLHYTRLLVLPLLAMGMVLTGCDSGGSNGDDEDNGNGSDAPSYSTSDGSYAEEVAVNILAFELGIRTGSNNVSGNSESALDDLYTGTNLSGQTLPTELKGSPEQSTYGDIATVNLSSLVSGDNLLKDDNIPGVSSPANTDKLLKAYFKEAGANDNAVIGDGIVISQFAEKMLLGTPIYGKGATLLSDFANGNVSSNRAEKWDAAFGYFGFPKTLEPFLDYSGGGEGLAGGPVQDLDGNGSIDLESEYAYTWATYAIERSATAENENDFARRAFEALVEGRNDIENGDDPSDHAETALQAWEEVVAVNVIHYINSIKGSLPDSGTLQDDDLDEGAWGEAKAFAWGLQFYSDELDNSQLTGILENIGNAPPYVDLTVSEYTEDLDAALNTLETQYDFDPNNVDNW